MHYFVKTIALFSVLTFSGCQLTHNGDSFSAIESGKKDVDTKPQSQETKKITTSDTNTISIKDKKQQEADINNVDTLKHIEKPTNGGIDDKEIITKKIKEAVASSNSETKQKNRFVVDISPNDLDKIKQKCNCQYNNNSTNTQENALNASIIHSEENTLYIQVGVFSNFDTANTFAKKIKDNGIHNVKVINEDNMMKVIIGGFADRKSGQKIINKLYDIGVDDYFWKNIK